MKSQQCPQEAHRTHFPDEETDTTCVCSHTAWRSDSAFKHWVPIPGSLSKATLSGEVKKKKDPETRWPRPASRPLRSPCGPRRPGLGRPPPAAAAGSGLRLPERPPEPARGRERGAGPRPTSPRGGRPGAGRLGPGEEPAGRGALKAAARAGAPGSSGGARRGRRGASGTERDRPGAGTPLRERHRPLRRRTFPEPAGPQTRR